MFRVTFRQILVGICCAAICLQVGTRASAAPPPEIANENATIKNPNAEFLKIEARDSADELWARALWLSLPFQKATSDEVSNLFTAALSRAKTKAPIYVSFGDVDSGPNRMREMMDRAMETFSKASVAELARDAEKLIEKLDVPGSDGTKVLQYAMQDAYKKALERDDVRGSMGALMKTMKDGTDATAMFYLAAVGEDAGYMPGWFRLAVHSQGETRARAVAQFLRRDSDNALPYYLRAFGELEIGDLAAALKSVQSGNALKICRIYDPPRPKNFTLRYPNHEQWREFGVVGEPLGSAGLDFLLARFEEQYSWSDPLPPGIRSIIRKFTEEGTRLRKSGQVMGAIEYLEAADKMGWQLLKTQPRDFSLVFVGLASMSMSYEELKAGYKSLDDDANVLRLDKSYEMRQRLVKEIRKSLGAEKLSPDEAKDALLGKKFPHTESRLRLEKALIDSGVIDATAGK